jgi:hypothetical protein
MSQNIINGLIGLVVGIFLMWCAIRLDSYINYLRRKRKQGQTTITLATNAQFQKGDVIEIDGDKHRIVNIQSHTLTLVREKDLKVCTHDPNTCEVGFCDWPNCNILGKEYKAL